jgi:mRNA interferase RelE/StbE
MIYNLEFKPRALKEWKKLDNPLKEQFKKKLKTVLKNPKIAHNKLSSYENIYKLKLRSSGYRLAYEVKENEVVVLVLKIGKRDKFYENLKKFTSE